MLAIISAASAAVALGTCPDDALPCAGRCLRAITSVECPSNLDLPNCDDALAVAMNDYCEADGECETANLEYAFQRSNTHLLQPAASLTIASSPAQQLRRQLGHLPGRGTRPIGASVCAADRRRSAAAATAVAAAAAGSTPANGLPSGSAAVRDGMPARHQQQRMPVRRQPPELQSRSHRRPLRGRWGVRHG